MKLRNIFKIGTLALTLAALQACASTPKTQTQTTKGHIKTEVPAPFPITPESLRKEREAEARKQGLSEQSQ